MERFSNQKQNEVPLDLYILLKIPETITKVIYEYKASEKNHLRNQH